MGLTLPDRWEALKLIPAKLGKARAEHPLRTDGRLTFLGSLDEMAHESFGAKGHSNTRERVMHCLAETFGFTAGSKVIAAEARVNNAPSGLRQTVAIVQLFLLFNLPTTSHDGG